MQKKSTKEEITESTISTFTRTFENEAMKPFTFAF